MPVFVSWNVSSPDQIHPGSGAGGGGGGGCESSAPELHAFVERALVREIKTCQKLGMLRVPDNVQ